MKSSIFAVDMSRIREIVDGIFRGGNRFFRGYGVSLGGLKLSAHPFSEVVYYNALELLTDLSNDVTWKFGDGMKSIAAAFIRFYNKEAKLVYTKYFDEGYVVIVHETIGEGSARVDQFRIARKSEYTKTLEDDYWRFKPSKSLIDSGAECYVLASSTMETTGQSDKQLLRPFLVSLDNALNASNTITERLGAMVVCSPTGSANTFGRLNEEEKKVVEAEINKEYGALIQQSQFLLLPREMNVQIVSLAALDIKTQDRVKTSVLAIADRLKVPANQIAMIDADASKALSNGSELVAGDLAKYKSFERLLDATFVRMARDIGLPPVGYEDIDGVKTAIYYGIYNKPKYKADEENQPA